MLRYIPFGVLGIVMLASMCGNVSSQPHDASMPSLTTTSPSSKHAQLEDTFVPDSLPSEDDDSEEPVENLVQKSTEAPNREAPSMEASSSSSTGSLQQAGFKNSQEGKRRLPKDTQEVPRVLKVAATNPMSRVASRSVTTSDTASQIFKAEKNNQAITASEEEKLLTTTRKLVKWLRNRLRKRLGEVAGLEEKCEVEKKLLRYLNETIRAESNERQLEIKEKLETQNELRSVKRHFSEPDRELSEVRKQQSQLFGQLSDQKKIYEDLAGTQKQMEDRLVSAGFTYWLDKRGKEYMPATAVGVLSKSAQLLNPLSRGLEEVLKFDELFSSGLGSVIPISQRSLPSKILRDMALLLPIFPIVMLLWRINQISQRLSVVHLIMYISIIFAIESSLAFGFSICIGAEAIREVQKAYELFVVTGVFMNVLLFAVMVIAQMLVMALRPCRSEIMQSLLIIAVGVHFYRTVFQPVVVNRLSSITIAAHAIYALNFVSIGFEKKAALQVGTRFDKHLNAFLLSVERWVYETFEAMKYLFEDTLPDLSDDDTVSSGGLTLSSQNRLLQEFDASDDHAFHGKEADVADAAKALNASKGYARWIAGRTRYRDGQGRPSFRGIRRSQLNPQLPFLQSESRKRAK